MNSQSEAILEIFLDRIRKRYPDDVCLVFAYGSQVTGGASETSDLDLVIVPRTKRGSELAMSFVVGGVGYDFFTMNWARLERIASFDDPLTAVVAESQVVYSASREYEERFSQLRGWIMDTLDFPLRMPMVERAGAQLERAMGACARMQLATDPGEIRARSGEATICMSDVVCFLNNRYFKRGIKKRTEAFRAMRQLPEDFLLLYDDVIDAQGETAVRAATWALLASVRAFYERMYAATREPVVPREALAGTYEEMVCNWRHKILGACESGDKGLAFLAATSMQGYLDDRERDAGVAHIDLMGHFDAARLDRLCDAYEQAERAYLQEMKRLGIPVRVYATIEDYRKAMA